MDFLTLIASIPLANWLAILLPCMLLFVLVWWRQRRSGNGGRAPKRLSELKSWGARGAYFARLLGFAGLSLLLVSLSLIIHRNSQAAKDYIMPAPSQVETPSDYPYPLDPIVVHADDGVELRGWLIEPRRPATVILLHGYGSNRISMLWHAEQLAEAGFGVLLYDERSSGESGGQRRSYGWEDPVDVAAAIDFLEGTPATAGNRVGIVGCSIGGQIALQAAAQDQRLEAVWADGPSIVRAADLPKPYNWVSLIASLSGHIFDWTLAARLQRLPPEPMILRLPALSNRPVQFVAGGTAANALGAEAVLVGNYLRHAGPGADLWVVPEAVHCDGHQVAPDMYSERMVSFFERSLLE